MDMSQKMQSDLGKLFIGGISWDTNEEHLKGYFSRYGEVLECVVMKDRVTGRGRGFGFVVFADSVVAERVTKEKHNINGRMVEATKAVPRNDQTTINRNNGSIKTSPGSGQRRKIFVGGLASTVTETDFKRYFEQFGTITDVVVMYDPNTKRPRGFGFITYDSEDAVSNVLLKTFHQLNGKMVEVKRAVPKEPSPGLTQTTIGSYPYGLNRTSNFLDGYTQQPYSPSPIGGYNININSRFSPIRNGYDAYRFGYGIGLNLEPTTSENYNNSVNYGRSLNPYYVGNPNRFGNSISFDGGNTNGSNISLFSSNPRNPWGNRGLNAIQSGNGVIRGGLIGNTALNLGVSPVSPQERTNTPPQTVNFGYGRNTSVRGYDVPLLDLNASSGSELTWPLERDGSGSFGAYGLASSGSDVQTESSLAYIGGYSGTYRQENRGLND